MCCTDGDNFSNNNCTTSSNDQLCRYTFLYIAGWRAGCNADWYSGRNIFIYCRINDQCGDRCDYPKFKHSGNLYGYLYNGSRWWVRCTDCYYFCDNNYITCSNDKLCGKSILYFTGWGTGGNPYWYSGRNIFIYCRINNQCGDRCDYSKFKHSGNLYGYLYNG